MSYNLKGYMDHGSGSKFEKKIYSKFRETWIDKKFLIWYIDIFQKLRFRKFMKFRKKKYFFSRNPVITVPWPD